MNDDYINQTLQAYDANPEKYEMATSDMTPFQELETFIEQVPNKDYPILDAGCAFGRDTAVFAERGFAVIGIDMSNVLLERAKVLYPNIQFEKMDVRQLGLAYESVGGIWCHATLLHLKDDDIQIALAEFRRVLVPGGIVFMSFKQGIGDEQLVETFSSDSVRYFNYQSVQTVTNLVTATGLEVGSIYTINERARWGADKRDLNWVYCFARKI